MNELELIRRCLKKEKKAWDIFVEKYSRLIYWSIRKRLNASGFKFNQDDIKGIFQEVFLSILEGDKLGRLKAAKVIPGWLAIIASNKTVDFMRYKIRENRRLIPDAPILKDDNFKQELDQRDLFDLIGSSINSLSDKAKIVISFNLFQGRTHKEISNIMNMSINTVSTLIARAKETLKQDLEKKGIRDL
ncbi:MAG: sigma-70 family RNA polymerase sigma factor [Candidatus Omnitrophica bacterium]|nr:sigma-70 family RNA polymerase sigma factor [Candidatus Omnitrophota bacterium]